MTAMNWLASQLAWERRLTELRADRDPAEHELARHVAEAKALRHDQKAAAKAA